MKQNKARTQTNLSKDVRGAAIQTAPLDTDNAQDVTSAVVIDANASRIVLISGEDSANIQVEDATFTPGATGLYYIGGTYLAIEVPAGWYIGSTVSVRVCPFGLGE